MTRYGSLMAQHIYQRLVDNRVPLGLVDVWYGDQNMLPHTPSACVIQGDFERELVGTPRRVDQNTTVFVMVYHNAIQDTQENELQVAQLAEVVAKFLDDDSRLTSTDYPDGLVIHSFVTRFEPGYKTFGNNSKYRTTRLTWTGYGRVNLNTDP